jgi:hypothetical protein
MVDESEEPINRNFGDKGFLMSYPVPFQAAKELNLRH